MTDLLLQSLVYQFWSALAQSIVCGILLAAGVRALLALISPAPSAATRYAVWFATLVAVAVMPLVFVLRSGEAQSVASEVRRSVAPLAVSGDAGNRPIPAVVARPVSVEVPPTVPVQRTGDERSRWLVLPLTEDAGTAFSGFAIFVGSLLMLRLLFSYFRVWLLKRRVIEAPPEALERFHIWRAQCPTNRPVRLLVSRKASSPMAVGFRHPAIIVPESLLLQLTREEFDHIGLHELAHIRRGDHWTNLAERIVQALFWFSPAVHYICHRLELERELACDDEVLSVTAEPKRYARSLARVLQLAPWRRGPVLASGAVFRKRQILKRIESLFDSARNSVPRVSALTVVVIVMCLFGLIGEFVRMPALIAFDRAFSGSHNRNRWTNNGRTIELETAGEVRFGTLEPTVESVSPEGYVRVREAGGTSREIVYTAAASGDGLATRYLVDGREVALDTTGRQWAANMLAWVIRESGINADERVAAIFDKHGAQGVLDEVDRMSNDHTRRRYLSAMLDTAHTMTPEDQRRVLARVTRIGSDHEKAELLKQTSARVKEEAVRSAYFDAVRSIRSDHDHRRVLQHILGEFEDDTAVLAMVARSAQSIDSAHDRSELLKSGALVENVIKASEVDLRREYLQAVTGIRSSHDKANVLANLLERSPSDAGVVQEIVRVAGSIESDHDRGRVLKNAISTEAPTEAVAGDLLATVEKINSDHEKANLLIRLAAGPYTPAFHKAVRSVNNDHDKERVIHAMLERGQGVEAAQAAVALTTALSGDHPKSELLQKVIAKHGDKAEIQTQIRRAAEKIGSDAEYRRVMSKLTPRAD